MKLICLILILCKGVDLVRVDEEAEQALLIPVDLRLDGEIGHQIHKLYHPGCYDSYIFSGLRVGHTDIVINNLIRGINLVYFGAKTLVNRRIIHTIIKHELEIVEIVSYHTGVGDKYEYVELIKTPEVSFFIENIKQAVTVNLADLNSLPLYVDTRSHPNGTVEVFVSDIFKAFVMLGVVNYGANLVESTFHNCVYRSTVFKPVEDNKVHVTVTSFLKNGKRNKNYYDINTEANIQGSVVNYVKTTTTYVGNIPEDLG
ncbi:hypothetical protein TpMuguga_03g00031 [Theileria parva strain Muguga]|uniref:Uncharacterized protein n=1 Tax=Theileria parva TaxID=5875 RepID=Q4N0S6_THEPA|nr:uncharacterized protein TpMuguga_03g00031 [Theileria parva strain Muguga]EAN30767.1 hypothetical protein TpMuguga_03g00031 [Theileria parva strain Muguga]|eukprot:XP_763050.1 hypothetical protein [Theileria parva strain Muguga]